MESPTRIPPQAWMSWPVVQNVMQAFAQEKRPLRFVGGCVRDSLLGRPVTDVDAATPLTPQAVMGLLKKHNIRVIPTGIDHGTLTARVEERSIEITTLRRDVDCDGRHAEVEFTEQWQEDAARRDFTINALYADADGTVYDYVGGLEDIAQKHLRFIGEAEARIAEDALRILRFFRFSAQLHSKEVDAQALAACSKCASRIEQLSGERIAQEMKKFLTAKVLSPELIEAFNKADLAPYLLLPSLPDFLQEAGSLSVIAKLALWLTVANNPQQSATQVAPRWKLSNVETMQLFLLIKQSGEVSERMIEAEQKKRLRLLGKETYSEALEISRIRHGKPIELYTPLKALANSWKIPSFPLRGEDLLGRGIKAGPQVGEALKRLEAEWEQSDYQLDKDALLQRL